MYAAVSFAKTLQKVTLATCTAVVGCDSRQAFHMACMCEDGSHQVERQAIVGEDDDKEDQVDEQVKHVSHELQVEHIDSLVLPAPFHVVVNHRQHVLEEG